MLDRGGTRAYRTQVFGSKMRVTVNMDKVVMANLITIPRVRLWNPAKLDRITEGVLKSLRARGYDVPLRRVWPRNGKAQLTVPWFVRDEMCVIENSEVVLCRNADPKILDMAEVGMLDERDVDGKPILDEVVIQCKVRRDGGSLVISIKKEAQVVLGNVLWRYLNFGLTNFPGKVTLKIFETETSASRLTSTLPECLRRWPVQVLDAAEAWRIGFEPYLEALEFARIPPRYPERGLLNMPRFYAVNQVMIETADLQAELRRSEQCSISYSSHRNIDTVKKQNTI